MLNDFKQFALKGNVIDLAVGVIIGGAFGKIVTSLVNDIIIPFIGLVLGGVDLTTYSITFGKAVIKYGAFLQTVVDFTIIAFIIFLVIRLLSRFKKKEEIAIVVQANKTEELLTEIRDLLRGEVEKG
jgi:large conductance mechanosensitive channel